MDKTQKLQYQKDVEKYLEEKKVYDIFEDLMKSLIIDQPQDPMEYLVSKLSESEQKKIFIVGPPGSKIRELALELSNYLNYTCISVGDLLKKEISKKSEIGQQIETSVRQYNYVKDEIVIDIVLKKLDEVNTSSDVERRNYVLEGFPKTRVQGLALQRKGIIPSTFIIYNVPDSEIESQSSNKLANSDGYYSHIREDKRSDIAANHSLEYRLNLSQVKEIYANNFFQVDSKSRYDPLEDMAKLVKFKIDSKGPKRTARILVIGPPGSGRSTLSRKLAKKYGLIYVATRELIMDQIRKNTELGQTAFNYLQKGDLIPDEIIRGLVHERVQQVDCHLQGYIIDGFPKNMVQLLDLEDLKINPSLIVILEASDDLIKHRLLEKKVDPITGNIYDKLNPINDPEIQRRLENDPRETQEIVAKRNKRWKDILKAVEQTFQQQSQILLKISADQDSNNIVEQVSIHLEKSV